MPRTMRTRRTSTVAVAMDPTDSIAHIRLGHNLLFGRKYQEAVDHFKEGLKANPNDAD